MTERDKHDWEAAFEGIAEALDELEWDVSFTQDPAGTPNRVEPPADEFIRMPDGTWEKRK